jgi:protein TonB
VLAEDRAVIEASALTLMGSQPFRARSRSRRAAGKARAAIRLPPAQRPPGTGSPERDRAARASAALAVSLAAHAALVGLAILGARAPARAVPATVPIEFIEALPPEPTPTPVAPPATPSAPVVAVRTVHRPVPRQPEPPSIPSDPVDVPPEPTPPLPEPPRRVVGLSLESTTTAGSGPAYATGNTRMGQTDATAVDPSEVHPAPSSLMPPRRSEETEPEYPPELRAAGVEGDVGLEAQIDAEGQVIEVTVVRPAERPAFDRAAVDAAKRSHYEPAQLNGVAVPYIIRFTVRFRLRHSAVSR